MQSDVLLAQRIRCIIEELSGSQQSSSRRSSPRPAPTSIGGLFKLALIVLACAMVYHAVTALGAGT